MCLYIKTEKWFITIIQRKDTDVTLCCIIKQFGRIGWTVLVNVQITCMYVASRSYSVKAPRFSLLTVKTFLVTSAVSWVLFMLSGTATVQYRVSDLSCKPEALGISKSIHNGSQKHLHGPYVQNKSNSLSLLQVRVKLPINLLYSFLGLSLYILHFPVMLICKHNQSLLISIKEANVAY